MVNTKSRYWAFVLYPESAPDDWQDVLIQTGLPIIISPLHDKDKNADGSQKKAHYHVILIYPNTTTFNSIKRITDSLNQPHPQYINALRGYYNYLTHKDNPEKFQYNENDIKSFNGFHKDDYFQLNPSDENEIYSKLENIIIEHEIKEFYHLIIFLKYENLIDELNFIRRHTIYFKEFINSYRYASIRRDSVEA